MTPAQQAAAYIAALDWTPQKVAMFTQVDQRTVRRWLAEADANDAGTTTGVNVEMSRVMHLQALVGVVKLAPGISLRLPSAMPDQWLRELATARPVIASWEWSADERRQFAVVTDGAEPEKKPKKPKKARGK